MSAHQGGFQQLALTQAGNLLIVLLMFLGISLKSSGLHLD